MLLNSPLPNCIICLLTVFGLSMTRLAYVAGVCENWVLELHIRRVTWCLGTRTRTPRAYPENPILLCLEGAWIDNCGSYCASQAYVEV